MLHTDYTLFFDNPVRTLARFWAKVQQTETCWLWTASKRNKGYGAFVWYAFGHQVQGRAHVFSYRLHCGDIPDGLFVLHRCDNPACVNPAHLFLGTKADNNRDMADKGRANSWGHKSGTQASPPRGVAHWNSKLNEDTVREIRGLREAGCGSNWALGLRFGVSSATISRVVNRIDWGWVQ